jgi:hypothetical protein
VELSDIIVGVSDDQWMMHVCIVIWPTCRPHDYTLDIGTYRLRESRHTHTQRHTRALERWMTPSTLVTPSDPIISLNP